jgi:multidrug efflux pump subunit AcrA (membrane-fusion protein)
MENNINPIAEQAVAGNEATNTNGVPGSLPGETKAETVARMYKVMVDGQELEVDEKELTRGYAHNKAASKRMEEAAMSRKEAESVLRMFKDSPRQAMQRLGIDVRNLAEEVIQEELNDAMLSPEAKELRKYKAELERYQSSEKQAREQYEAEQLAKQEAQYTEQLQSQIVSTLDTAGLPRTERTVSRIAYYMQSALNAGFPNVSPADVIEYVKKDHIDDIKSTLGALNEDQIAAFLDAETIKKVNRYSSRTASPVKTVPREVNANITRKDTKKPLSPREYFKRH